MTPCLKRLGCHVLIWYEVLHDALPGETGQPCGDVVSTAALLKKLGSHVLMWYPLQRDDVVEIGA